MTIMIKETRIESTDKKENENKREEEEKYLLSPCTSARPQMWISQVKHPHPLL
jgi:hypothetical protein